MAVVNGQFQTNLKEIMSLTKGELTVDGYWYILRIGDNEFRCDNEADLIDSVFESGMKALTEREV